LRALWDGTSVNNPSSAYSPQYSYGPWKRNQWLTEAEILAKKLDKQQTWSNYGLDRECVSYVSVAKI
jgi:hypothetical protein